MNDPKEVVYWLLNPTDEFRGTGRTYIMAQAFIRIALENPGRKINVFDHHRPDLRQCNYNIIRELKELSTRLPQDLRERLVINQSGWVKLNEQNNKDKM